MMMMTMLTILEITNIPGNMELWEVGGISTYLIRLPGEVHVLISEFMTILPYDLTWQKGLCRYG